MKLSDTLALARPDITAMPPYRSARDEHDGGRDCLYLDANECPGPADGPNRYPDPRQRALRAAAAEYYQVAAEQIMPGNGSDEVLDTIMRVFCEPGRSNMIGMPPTYAMYPVLATVNALEFREVPLNADFQPDVEAVLAAADSHTRGLIFCHPSNPSGNAFSDASLDRLLHEFPGLVVVDEAYAEFHDPRGLLPRLPDHPNLIITRTLSKAFGLAGIRLGFACAHPEVIALLDKVRHPYNIGSDTQRRACAAFADAPALAARLDQIRVERDKLAEGLRRLSIVSQVFPSDSNFLLFRVDDAPLRYRQLRDRGILLRDRSGEPLCADCLRVSVGLPEQNQHLLATLAGLA